MIRTIRNLSLGIIALACGFGSVFLVFTHVAAPISAPSGQNTHVAVGQNPGGSQHYVINLLSGTEPIELATVQHPDALAKYQVYTKQLTIDDTVWHLLRLGFFSDVKSAEKVAALLRDDYPLARIAPVPPQEWAERANASLVALVAADSPRPTIAKGKTVSTERRQPELIAPQKPSTMHVALSAERPAHEASAPSEKAIPTKCDTLAAHPWDPSKLTEGVYWNQVPAAKAVLECRNAVRNEASPRNMFQYGRALAKSHEYVEAVEWYKKSANKGYVQAQYALGDVYEFGEGVEMNYVLAQSWYKKAAEQGYTHALSKLDRLKNATITNTRQQMATADTGSTSTP